MVSTAPLPIHGGFVAWPTVDLGRASGLLRDLRCPDGVIEALRHYSRSVTGDTNAVSASGATATTAASTTTNGVASDPDHVGDSLEPAEPVFDASSVTMEDLIRDHADAVYRVALSVTRDPSLAEDVSQDALIKAWQALPTFRGASPLRNWVLRITHNTAISTLRRRRDELRPPESLPERVSVSTVESQVQDRLAITRFEEALDDLDDLSRSIVVLREVEGLSYSELCEVLDLPMPTIKTRLLRARRQLARALEGWQP